MDLIWYGILYSFVGFLLEVAFARATGAHKQDRKCFLLLPLCPVYGLGAVAILLLPGSVQRNPILLFLGSALCASVVEYAMSLFYEKCWGVSFWNYSALRGNVRGRICLPFSLCWGVLGIALVYGVQPLLSPLVSLLPHFLLPPVVVLLLADFLASGALLRQTHSTDSLMWYRSPRL